MVEANQVAWTRSSGSQFRLASPLGQPRLRESSQVRGRQTLAGPGSHLPLWQPPSQHSLQAAARVIVSPSSTCECRAYRDRHTSSTHAASGEGGVAGLCQGH